MSLLNDGSTRLTPDEIAARPWLGDGVDAMRVLHVDEVMGQVIFIQRFGRDSTHLKHTHHGTAIAYTLRGCWAYAGEPFPEGTVAFEPVGSDHTAMTQDGNTAEVLVVLTAGPGKTRLLELEAPDGGRIELDMAAFKALEAMTSEEEWTPFAESLAGATKQP